MNAEIRRFHAARCYAEAHRCIKTARDVYAVQKGATHLGGPFDVWCNSVVAGYLASALWYRDTAREWRRSARTSREVAS